MKKKTKDERLITKDNLAMANKDIACIFGSALLFCSLIERPEGGGMPILPKSRLRSRPM